MENQIQKGAYGVWSKDRYGDVYDYLASQNVTLSKQEFITYIEIGRLTGLNPFLREIWAVKYGKKAASIFIGRDGYRKSAQRHEKYESHSADAVYEKDSFFAKNGEVTHTYAKEGRGELLGAYCIVHRKGAKFPAYNYVEFNEYYLGHKKADGSIKSTKYGPMKPTLWDSKPATMIKKVAEAQGLRGSFQELFAGTYEESEQWEAEEAQKPKIIVKENVIDVSPPEFEGEAVKKTMK